jgi:mycofactocin precursor
MDDTQVIDAPAESDDSIEDTALVEEELLVEEVSIDGMCGVY